jgi:hypothetical protein
MVADAKRLHLPKGKLTCSVISNVSVTAKNSGVLKAYKIY